MANEFSRRAVVLGGIAAGGGWLSGPAVAEAAGGPRATDDTQAASGMPEQIFVIRHAEKPNKTGPPYGVDTDGQQNQESLLTRGWRRAGALVVLFDPPFGTAQPPLSTPTALYAPLYEDQAKFHRTYQTVLGLSERMGIPVQTLVPDTEGPVMAQHVVTSGDRVVLISWEHRNIPFLAQAIPVFDGTVIPQHWPDDRFDIIWIFTLDPTAGRYRFSQIPQRVVEGDLDTVL